MKIVLMVMVFMLGFGIAEYSHGNMSCGLKPLPPLGCQVAYCQCDDRGCRWVFSCE